VYQAYITRIKNLRKHPNADRLQLGECFGNTVCVSLEYEDNQLGVYFPTDGQLSIEFCDANNLVRKKDDAGNNIGGYMDPDKRNVTAIRLRGEKSDGLFLPLSSLEWTGVDLSTLTEGFCFTTINGKEICQKYIPRRPNRAAAGQGSHTRKKKVNVAPLFAEHADTEQLAYNLGAFKPGDEIEITLKMHGTSQRTGYLPVLKGYKRTLWDKILRREGTPIYDWGYVSGTRRVVLDNYDGGFYGSNEFREQHSKVFEGKLWKGETVYYEVVGFTQDGTPIMASANNAKLNDKDFIKQYGKETVFSYGCKPTGVKLYHGEDEYGVYSYEVSADRSALYVYRMTMTNEDGQVVEYTPGFMRYRCEQMGVKTVPVFGKAIISSDRLHFIAPDGYDHDYRITDENVGEAVIKVAEEFYDGPDPVGKTHVREGVVVRIINRPKFCAYKHKNFAFKVLEGIIKDVAEAPDMEEAQDVE
jgi:hypothetical protein